jgi:multiple sugar transport system substrate-binding protein
MAGSSVVASAAIAVGSYSTAAATARVSHSDHATAHAKLSGTLTMALQSFGDAILQPVINAFKHQNPGVTIQVQVTSAPGTAYQTSLLTDKLGGNLPDIINPQDVLAPTLETDGIIRSLTPYLKKGEPYPQSAWLPNILASYIPPKGPGKGQVFALPNEADAVVMYYNVNEFKAAHLPLPTDNWTWSQMLKDAAKLKKVSNGVQTRWGLCDRADWQAIYNPLINALTGKPSLSETSANMASPGALQAWQMLINPMQNGDAVPYATYLSSGANCSSLFEAGQTAMMPGVRGNLPTLRPAVKGKFNFNVVPMPMVGNKRPTGAGSIAWAISTQAKHVSLALDFFHFLYSQEGQRLEEQGYGVVPSVTSGLGPNALWRKLPGPPSNVNAFAIAARAGLIAPQTPKTVYSLSQTDIPKAIEAVVDEHQSYKTAFGQLNSALDAQYKS